MLGGVIINFPDLAALVSEAETRLRIRFTFSGSIRQISAMVLVRHFVTREEFSDVRYEKSLLNLGFGVAGKGSSLRSDMRRPVAELDTRDPEASSCVR